MINQSEIMQINAQSAKNLAYIILWIYLLYI